MQRETLRRLRPRGPLALALLASLLTGCQARLQVGATPVGEPNPATEMVGAILSVPQAIAEQVQGQANRERVSGTVIDVLRARSDLVTERAGGSDSLSALVRLDSGLEVLATNRSGEDLSIGDRVVVLANYSPAHSRSFYDIERVEAEGARRP